tara:strand:- start:424 stop:873 length:450 start_codon:yes stop_codon:yes gene_type:complete
VVSPKLNSSSRLLAIGTSNAVDFYTFPSQAPVYGGTALDAPNPMVASAGSFGWSLSSFALPVGYVSLDALSAGTMTVSTSSFAALDMTPSLITVADWGAGMDPDKMVQLQIVASIPEPSSVIVVGALFAALFLFIWRKRQKERVRIARV